MLALYLTYIDDEQDKKIFEKIYYSYRKQMMLLALSILNNEADAEDVVHEVFLCIVSKYINILSDIKNEIDMRNYLLKATKNTALNWKKKRSRIILGDEDDDFMEYCNFKDMIDDDFEEFICQKYEYERVLDAINTLDVKYKEVLYYHFVMDLPISKVATLLGKSIGTTKKQLVRGKKKLLFLLGEKEA